MKLRSLPSSLSLRGKRVFVRVDWNVPLQGGLLPEESLKIERSLPMLRALAGRGAIVIVLTHLGRPEGRDPALSTRHLLPLLAKRYQLNLDGHTGSVSNLAERGGLLTALTQAANGSLHLLENVRFEKGEETNDAKLVKAYSTLGHLFVNDAFASCHRAHASVAGLAKALPSYAGSSLIEEVGHLNRLLAKPKKPFVAVIGGLKLSTKIPVLQSLLSVCDRVLIGGAMATTFASASGRKTGASFIEKGSLKTAKELLKKYAKKISLPVDVMVTKKIGSSAPLRHVLSEEIGAKDIVIDVGARTLKMWGAELQKANTILWNGPVGVVEQHASAAGSRFLARVIGSRAKGKAFGVAGGGDTIPVIVDTKTLAWFDFVSTGGGALLEFLAKKGKLPGLVPLIKK